MRFLRLTFPLLAAAGLAGCMSPVPDPPEVAACKAGVSAQSGTTGAALLSSEPVIDGKLVRLRDGNGSTWRCTTDTAGLIESIELEA